jgi:hypothetical protein
MKRSSGDPTKSKINYATNKRRTQRDGEGKEREWTRNRENVTCHGPDEKQTFRAHCLPRYGSSFTTAHLVHASSRGQEIKQILHVGTGENQSQRQPSDAERDGWFVILLLHAETGHTIAQMVSHRLLTSNVPSRSLVIPIYLQSVLVHSGHAVA